MRVPFSLRGDGALSLKNLKHVLARGSIDREFFRRGAKKPALRCGAHSPIAAMNPSMPTSPTVTPHAASVGDECS